MMMMKFFVEKKRLISKWVEHSLSGDDKSFCEVVLHGNCPFKYYEDMRDHKQLIEICGEEETEEDFGDNKIKAFLIHRKDIQFLMGYKFVWMGEFSYEGEKYILLSNDLWIKGKRL